MTQKQPLARSSALREHDLHCRVNNKGGIYTFISGISGMHTQRRCWRGILMYVCTLSSGPAVDRLP